MEASHFHLDIYGHPEQAHVGNALEELNYFASEVRILGSYPVHGYRKTTEFV